MKIDFLLPNTSLYGVLHHFTTKFYEAFVRAGHSCRLLDGDMRYLAPLESPPDLTIGFNGAIKIDDGRLYCDLIRVPHLACLVDPPFRFYDLLASPHIMITCDDMSGCEDLKSLNFHHAFFMPHATERDIVVSPEVDRNYDVVMLATFVDCEERKLEWVKKYPVDICRGMEEAAEMVLEDEHISLIAALKKALGSQLLHSDGRYKLGLSVLQSIFSEVELYVKGKDKLDLLHSITGHEVHVFGNSVDEKVWEHYFRDRENIIVHPAVSFVEALEIMKRTKILLNSCIKNKQGAHERVFSGMASGAVVVTNDNEYLRKNFIDPEEIVLYRRGKFEEVNERIHLLLANEPKRRIIAEQGRQKVLSNHTWDHRVSDLIPLISMRIKP